MRIIIFLNNLESSRKLLKLLNPSVDAVVITENVSIMSSLTCKGKKYPLVAYKRLSEYISENEIDYVLISGNSNVEKLSAVGISLSKIIDVSGILTEEYLQKSRFFNGLKQSISTDIKLVAVGGLSALMGFSVDEYPVKGINLASPEQDLWMSYHILESVLSTPESKLKYALIGLSPNILCYDLSVSDDKWNVLSYYPIFKDTHNFTLNNKTVNFLFNEEFLDAYDSLNAESDNTKRLPPPRESC